MLPTFKLKSSTRKSVSMDRSNRGGFLMLVVCVLLLILISAAYVFSERMLVSNVASNGAMQRRQAISLSESGVAYARAKIKTAMAQDEADFDWPIHWSGEVSFSEKDRFGEFRLAYWDDQSQAWSSGVFDESCKLNLNQLPLDKLYAPEARRMLMCIPGMTLVIADSILDWMDEDDIQRQFGAESSYYRSQKPARSCRNRRLATLDELLEVRGVTRELLYGPSLTSPWETTPVFPAEREITPGQNSVQSIDQRLGFSAYLTVYGGSSVYRRDGNNRVFVNQDDLVQLYDDLVLAVGEDVATYLVAYRMVGPKDKSILVKDQYVIDDAEKTRNRASQQLGEGSETGEAGTALTRVEQRGPLTINTDGGFLIRSPYDLIGVPVEYQSDNGSLLIESPWPENEYTFRQALPQLHEELTFVLGTPIAAQVNVNQSPVEVLRSIPGISNDMVARIVENREKLGINARSSKSGTVRKRFSSIDWLRSSGGLSLEEMRILAPYVTNLGTAFRFISSGISHPTGATAHQEVTLDFRYPEGRISNTRIRELREMLTARVLD
jgi:type II secretory pathway component PulK